MASALAEKCFSPAVSCHNCERKLSNFFQETKTHCNIKTDKDDSGKEKKITVGHAEVEDGKTRNEKLNFVKDDSEDKKTKTAQDNKRKEGKKIIGHKGKAEVEDRETKNEKKDFIKDNAENIKVYSRCGGCWLMSYCDQTCQLEHWNHVHKYHCEYLSGKKIVNEHKEESCKECSEKKMADKEELLSIYSPRTGCRIEEESKRMQRELGKAFGFKKEAHSGSVEYACRHSFPMGNISDKHACTGLDEMLVHAAKLSNAIIIKSMNDHRIDKETIGGLLKLHKGILMSRIILWRAVLVFGSTHGIDFEIKDQLEFAENLNKKFGGDHAWWRALMFSVELIACVCLSHNWSSQDTTRVTDPKLLEQHNYHKSQIRNVSFVSENKLWHRFKFWPRLVNQSLVLVLPDDVSCVTCNADLSDQVVVPDNDRMTEKSPHPTLFLYILKNGKFAVTCSEAKTTECVEDFVANITDIKLNTTDEGYKEKKAQEVNGRMCQLCLRRSLCSHRCADCLAVQYCSMTCAKKDLAFHKTVCSTWAKDPTRKLMSAKKQMDLWKPVIEEKYRTK